MKSRFLVILFFFGLFCSCDNKQFKYLALGDSYTIGESVDENLRWPVQLVKRLREKGINMDDPEIIAKTGWTTDELILAINEETPVGPYDLVTLLIGVNNQYRGRNINEFKTQFKELLVTAISFADNNPENLYVLSIPDWGVSPFAEGRDRNSIKKEIDSYNFVKKEETLKAGAQFIDITEISRKASTDAGLIANDGLHPSAIMYSLWVKKLLEKLKDF